jgi:hypothetical protein
VTFPAAPLIETVTDWYCPSCALTEQTVNKDNRFHHCPKLRMVSPLVRQGVHAKIERHMRQDYIGNEQPPRARPRTRLPTTTPATPRLCRSTAATPRSRPLKPPSDRLPRPRKH